MDAYEKKHALEEALRYIRMAEEELDGTHYALILEDLTDAANDIEDELTGMQWEILAANREQEEEQEREYYAAVI